jgi:hypothetical protein
MCSTADTQRTGILTWRIHAPNVHTIVTAQWGNMSFLLISFLLNLCQQSTTLFRAERVVDLISYREALLSTLLHATVYMFLHNLLNVLVQIANKMGLQGKNLLMSGMAALR